jgi:hypothetical protein
MSLKGASIQIQIKNKKVNLKGFCKNEEKNPKN